MDMCLTFHIGLSGRIYGTDEEPDEVGKAILKAGRRMDAAFDALDQAQEVEDFQAVGMKVREALLALVREFADPAMIPEGAEEPKLGDFVHWSEFIVDALADSKNLSKMRTHLKSAAKDIWQIVNSLTHSTSADRTVSTLAAQAASHLFAQFATLMRAKVEEVGQRCPKCDSLRMYKDVRLDGKDVVSVMLCEVCGWESEAEPAT